MRLAPALLLTGLGGTGIYWLGTAVAGQRAATRRGERSLTLADADGSVGADLAAFGIAMSSVAVLLDQSPALLRDLSAILGD